MEVILPTSHLHSVIHVTDLGLMADLHFDDNESLFNRWCQDHHDRSGEMPQVTADALGERLRAPMLPDEEALYLLPVAKYAHAVGAVPVFLARGALPVAGVWSELVDTLAHLGVAGIEQRYEIVRPASLRPACLGSGSAGHALEATVRSLLDEVAEVSAVGQASCWTGTDWRVDPVAMSLLCRFHASHMLSSPARVRSLGHPTTSDQIADALAVEQAALDSALQLSDRERRFMLSAAANLAGRTYQLPNGDWAATWLIQQVLIDAFHRANETREVLARGATEDRSPAVAAARSLLGKRGALARLARRTLIGIDDSSRTGASHFLLKLVGNVVAPYREHRFAVLCGARSYGQRAIADIVCSDQELLYPEEEPERLPPEYLPTVGVSGPSALHARDKFRHHVAALKPTLGPVVNNITARCPLRRDTDLDAVEWLVARWLRGGNDPWGRLIVTEYLPNPHHNRVRFLDLGRKVLDFVRTDLARFDEVMTILEDQDAPRIAQLRELHRDCRHKLDGEAAEEFAIKRRFYLERQRVGVLAVAASGTEVRRYFAGHLSFMDLRRILRSRMQPL